MDRRLNGKLLKAAVFPVIFVVIILAIKLLEVLLDVSFSRFGMLPRNVGRLVGIITYPFIHGDWKHVFNNSVALLVLGTMLFHFYRAVALRSLFWMFLLSGIWLWLGGRPNYHIGASGMVYALFGFLFLSGILRRHLKLMALSLLVVFLYGSLVWGIFPMEEHISWEGHLFGMLAGMGVALAYRQRGPQRPTYSWDGVDEEEMPEWYIQEQERLREEQKRSIPMRIRYFIKTNKGEHEENNPG